MKKLGTLALSSDIFEKANIGLWAFELDEGCEPRMYVDNTMLKLIGLDHQVSPEETYHAWYDHIDPKHYGEVANTVDKMTEGIHAEVQYPWHHPNGEVWTVRCGGVRNYAYTKGIRIEGTHQNVTSMAHYEKRNLSDLLATLADNFLQVYFLDPYTGKFSSYAGNAFDGDENRDYSKIDFYQDVADRSGSIVHPDDKALIERMYSKENLIYVLESSQILDFIVRWPTGKGDDCVYMKNRLVPFVDGDGTKKIVIGVLDVTSEQTFEKKLEEKNIYLEYFLKSFQSAYVVDLSNDSYEVLHMDNNIKGFFTMNGGRKEMNEFINNHIHPEDRELIFKMSDSNHIKELLKNESEISFTIREYYDDIDKTVRVVIVRGTDNTKATVGFMDISDEVNKEKEYSRKMEAASKAKSTFLFNMSHDIRTPMNAILGFSDRLINHIDDKELVKDSAEKIKSSGQYLLSLINDVLDMARIESNKVILDEDVYNIKERAYELSNVFEVGMLQKDLTFKTDFEDIHNTLVWCDSLKLRQIVLNLVSNSIKYTPNGGSVSYEIHEKISDKPGYGRFEIIIKDTGIGMSKDFVDHIFEEFTRSDDSITKETQGTGLGMSIVGKLVDLMGGNIKINSELGKGTEIIVSLDLKIASEEEIKEAENINNSNIVLDSIRGIKILLVDDNELNREIAQDVLEDNGCIVVDVAENGVEALGKVKSAKPGDYDVILMDVQMPVMDGYEATKCIRALENKELANIPIIAMTANVFDEDRKNALEAGMNAHLIKPIDINKIKETLSKFIK